MRQLVVIDTLKSLLNSGFLLLLIEKKRYTALEMCETCIYG